MHPRLAFPLAFPLALALALALANLQRAGAEAAWPQFRGPNGQGLSSNPPPPEIFGTATNLLWRVKTLPGHSSPSLFGDRLYLTGVEDGKLHTLAFNPATGKKLWQQPAPATSIERVHPFSSPATPTPLACEDRVISYFGSFGLLCHDRDGKLLWTRPLPTPKSLYGTSSSPIRSGTTVILTLDSDDKSSRLLAVNLSDGTTAWETARPLSSSGWATPMLWNNPDRSEVVVLGARRLISYDSRSGKELWWLDGYSPETISIPVAGDNLLFVSSSGLAGPPAEGFESMSWPELARLDQNDDHFIQKSEVPKEFRITLRPELPADHPGRFLPGPFLRMFDSVDGNRDGTLSEPEFLTFIKQWGARAAPSLKAIRPGGNGDVTQSHLAWQLTRGIPEIPSPLFHQGRIYMIRDGGFLTCVRAATGDLLFQERIGAPGSYCASPVAAGNRIFVASHPGIVSCIEGGLDQLKVLARNNLMEKLWATPALGPGTIYVRTEHHMTAFAHNP